MKVFITSVLLLLWIVLNTGCTTMNKTIIKMFDNATPGNRGVVTEEDIKSLPEVIQNYLHYTGIIGKEKIRTVRLRQQGGFRLKPGEDFKTMSAVQYFNVDDIEFYWRGKVSVVTATDRFLGGKGDLTVRLLDLIKVSYADGPEVDQGEILRFLAEGVWFPSVFVNDYIRWEALGERSARATIVQNGLSASADFYFNDQYQVSKIIANRYMEKDGTFKMAVWEIRIKRYTEFNGIRIPQESHVIWKLEEGDFCWYKPEIQDIEYNVSLPY